MLVGEKEVGQIRRREHNGRTDRQTDSLCLLSGYKHIYRCHRQMAPLPVPSLCELHPRIRSALRDKAGAEWY